MRKTRILFVTACCLMIAALAIGLCGCGGSGDSSSDPSEKYADSEYLGTWTATTCEYQDVEMDVQDVIGEFTITFNADGSCSVSLDGDPDEGLWEPTDNGLKITDGKDDLEFTDKDGILVAEYMDAMVNFEKK